jgi:hypothetical protein
MTGTKSNRKSKSAKLPNDATRSPAPRAREPVKTDRRGAGKRKAAKNTDPVVAWCKEEHGLDVGKIRKRGLRHVDQATATVMLDYHAPSGGIVIPFYDRHGNLLCYTDQHGKVVPFFQIRFDKPTGKMKYGQPRGSGVHAYFDPCVDWETVSGQIIITEGAPKAMAGNDSDFRVVGLCGVNMAGGKSDGQLLLKEIEDLITQEQTFCVMMDSDVHSNINVYRAMHWTVVAVAQCGVRVKAYGFEPGPNGEKVGLDDYLLTHSAKELSAELDATPEANSSRELNRLLAQYAYLRNTNHVLEIPEIDTAPRVKPKVVMGKVESRIEHYDFNLWKPKEWKDVEAAALIFGGKKPVPGTKMWMESKHKIEYERIVYEPGEPRLIVRGGKWYWNIWEGPRVEPKEGDTTLWVECLDSLVPDPADRKYLEQWIAAQIIHRGLKILQSIVLWSSAKGTGKSRLGYFIGLLHGRKNYTLIEQPNLEGSFNEYVSCCSFLQIDEAHMQKSPDARKLATKLNNLVTMESLPLNAKYRNLEKVGNPINPLITSNFPDAIYIASDERRWRVIHATEKSTFSKKKMVALSALMEEEGDGFAAVLWRLQNEVDMEGFDASAHAERTQALEDMAARGRDDGETWAAEYKKNPVAVLSKHLSTRELAHSTYHTSEELHDAFKLEYPDSRTGKNALANKISAAKCEQVDDGKQFRIPGTEGRVTLWISNFEQHRKIKAENIVSEYLKDRPGLVESLTRERKYTRENEKP